MASDQKKARSRAIGRTRSAPSARRARPREFTAEITFNGLVVLQIGDPGGQGLGADPKPRVVEGVKVLFVKTDGPGEHDHGHHRHQPRLTYFADDHLGLMPQSCHWPHDYTLLPSPDGRQMVSIDLTEKQVEIIPSYNYRRTRSRLRWHEPRLASDAPGLPAGDGDDRCLDWVLSAGQIRLQGTDPSRAVTEIHVPAGDWRTHGIYRNREVRWLEPINWRVGSNVQALGRDLVLELHGLWYGLTLRVSNRSPGDRDPYDIVLTPGRDEQLDSASSGGVRKRHGDRLRFALTNLPDSYTHADVSHVTMYGDLSGEGDVVEGPVQNDDVVCAQSACTPVRQP